MFGRSKLVADPPRVKPIDLTPETEAPPARFGPAPKPEAPPAPVQGALQPEIKPSLISDAVSFVGELTSKGALQIDGSAKGTIRADSVTVGADGALDGAVSCKKLHVKGNFSGTVVCDELIIADEASVEGSLTYKSILIQRGARVAGEFFVVEGA
jgi:cytoskeletal protein CcmA (bactofilin family)